MFDESCYQLLGVDRQHSILHLFGYEVTSFKLTLNNFHLLSIGSTPLDSATPQRQHAVRQGRHATRGVREEDECNQGCTTAGIHSSI
jgi:hypothetical protein